MKGEVRVALSALSPLPLVGSVVLASARYPRVLFVVTHRISYPYTVDTWTWLTISILSLALISVLEALRREWKFAFLALAASSILLSSSIIPWLPAVAIAMCVPIAYRNASPASLISLAIVSMLQLIPSLSKPLGGPAWASLEVANEVCLILAVTSWVLSVARVDLWRISERNIGSDRVAVGSDEAMYVALIVIIGTLLFALPYTRYLNPYARPVSVDTVYYVRAIEEARALGPSIFFSKFGFGLDRVLFLLLLYAVSRFLDPYRCVILVTLFFHALLILSAWYLAKVISGDRAIAMLVAVLAALSPQTLAFLYGGFNANHAALPLLYIAYAEAVRRRYVRASILQGIAAFVHAWSWLQFSVAMLILSLAMLQRDRRTLTLLASLAATYLARQAIGGGVLNVIAIAPAARVSHYAIPTALASTLSATLYTLSTFYLWGVMNAPILYLLAALDRSLSLDEVTMLYAVSSIALLTSLPSLCVVLRTFMNLPMYVPAALLMKRLRRGRFVYALALVTISLSQFIYFVGNAVPR